MPFIHRIRLSGPKPTALYFHEGGYWEAFGSNGIVKGVEYVQEVMKNGGKALVEPADYILVALWGDKGVRVAQLWGYNGVSENWSANPAALDPLVFRNGIYQPDAKEVDCEMSIMLGREEENRLACRGMDVFMFYHPVLPKHLKARREF